MSHRLNSIFTRLILVFLATIVPLQICHYAIYRWSYVNTRDELVRVASSNVMFLRDEFETNARLIISQMEYLLANESITGFQVFHNSMSTSDYYMQARGIQSILALMRNSNPFIEQIKLYYPQLDCCITSARMMEQLDSSDIKPLLASVSEQGNVLIEQDGVLSIVYTRAADSYIAHSMPHYYVNASIKGEQLAALLSSFNPENDRHTFMVHHYANRIFDNGAPSAMRAVIARAERLTRAEGVYTHNIMAGDEACIMISVFSEALNCSFLQVIPFEGIFTIPTRLKRLTLLFSAVALLLVALYTISISRMVRKPVRDLVDAFALACSGDFNTRVRGKYASEYNALANSYNHMALTIQNLIQSDYESRIRYQKAELKQLQSQINPHFLYNSFYILRHSITEKSFEQAARLAEYLGDYFSFIADPSADVLPLFMEYEHAITYLKIQMIRFGEFAQADIAPLPEALSDLKVPRLILQPIFENAIEHGVPTAYDMARVCMSFEADGAQVMIHIDDNGDRLTDAKLNELANSLNDKNAIDEPHALANIHRRLIIFYGAPSCVRVKRSMLGGLRVTLVLLMTKEARTI